MNKFQLWLTSWCEIFDGIVGVLSLGFLRPSASYNLCVFFARRNGRKLAKKEKK